MGMADESGPRSRDFAQRFLQTAVVVDDEAYMASGGVDGPKAEVVAPGRHTRVSSQDDRSPVDRGSVHTLNASSVMDSFSALGVICGVVGPTDSAMETMRQADIVILDWLLRDGKPQCALKLLRDLLTGELDRNSLRLVAIYTGEARLDEICAAVSAELTEAGLDPVENETKTKVSYRHGRVVLYAKSGVNLVEPLKHRSVAEEDLPGRLVDDFASMTSGLLPRHRARLVDGGARGSAQSPGSILRRLGSRVSCPQGMSCQSGRCGTANREPCSRRAPRPYGQRCCE